MTISDRYATFRALHHADRPLTLANAWDVASARLVERAGAAAVATTSAGVAWSLGAADGDRLGRERAVELITRITAAVRVPVTADIEGGYAETADGVAQTVREVLTAGAAGINLEDTTRLDGAALRPIGEAADRIAAARAGGGAALFINARVDTYLRGGADPADLLRDALDRARAYVAAGADGVFVPGVTDPESIGALVAGIAAPLNVLAGPGSPDVAELGRLGVARISLGSSVAEAAYAVVERAARELLATGTYTSLAGALPYADLNNLLSD